MSEWLKEHAWKACVGETLPRVRIPLSPPNFAPLRLAERDIFRPPRGSRRDSARIPGRVSLRSPRILSIITTLRSASFGGETSSGLDAIAVVSGAASLVGYTVFRRLSADVIAGTIAVAAEAILAMLADPMMPEAFESSHDFAGLVTVLGFLAAFVLTKLGG